jgi:hypothetical protein
MVKIVKLNFKIIMFIQNCFENSCFKDIFQVGSKYAIELKAKLQRWMLLNISSIAGKLGPMGQRYKTYNIARDDEQYATLFYTPCLA